MGELENPLHFKMNGHRSDYYRRPPDKPIAKHFYNTPCHTFNEVSVMVVKQLRSAGCMRHNYRESYWIYTIQTPTPDGLN